MNDFNTEILNLLPYKEPFLFVDEIKFISQDNVTGICELTGDEYFYAGHFPEKKVTPGVIIIEIMAQIGLVCHGIYLKISDGESFKEILPAFSSTKVDFLEPVYPPDQLEVNASKIYFRFNKLKSEITCKSLSSGNIVCRGEFSGMIIPNING